MTDSAAKLIVSEFERRYTPLGILKGEVLSTVGNIVKYGKSSCGQLTFEEIILRSGVFWKLEMQKDIGNEYTVFNSALLLGYANLCQLIQPSSSVLSSAMLDHAIELKGRLNPIEIVERVIGVDRNGLNRSAVRIDGDHIGIKTLVINMFLADGKVRQSDLDIDHLCLAPDEDWKGDSVHEIYGNLSIWEYMNVNADIEGSNSLLYTYLYILEIQGKLTKDIYPKLPAFFDIFLTYPDFDPFSAVNQYLADFHDIQV